GEAASASKLITGTGEAQGSLFPRYQPRRKYCGPSSPKGVNCVSLEYPCREGSGCGRCVHGACRRLWRGLALDVARLTGRGRWTPAGRWAPPPTSLFLAPNSHATDNLRSPPKALRLHRADGVCCAAVPARLADGDGTRSTVEVDGRNRSSLLHACARC